MYHRPANVFCEFRNYANTTNNLHLVLVLVIISLVERPFGEITDGYILAAHESAEALVTHEQSLALHRAISAPDRLIEPHAYPEASLTKHATNAATVDARFTELILLGLIFPKAASFTVSARTPQASVTAKSARAPHLQRGEFTIVSARYAHVQQYYWYN